MRFSILVPVFNTEVYLEDCFASVFAQTEQAFELILVNDGSTDNSGKLCDRAAALHPDKVRVLHQTNRGLLAARRAAIAAAAGDFCVFLDSDDTLQPDALEIIGARLAHTCADILLYNFNGMPRGSRTLYPWQPLYDDGRVFEGADKSVLYREMITSWELNSLCMKAIRTQMLKDDPTAYTAICNNPHSEDLLQSLYPMTAAGRIAYCAVPLYNYRRNPAGTTQKLDYSRISRQFNRPVQDQLLSYMHKWGMDTPELLEIFHVRQLNGALSVFWQHFRAAVTPEMRRAVVRHPWTDYLTDDDLACRHSRKLSLSKRVQLALLLNKNTFLLTLFDRLGRLRPGR